MKFKEAIGIDVSKNVVDVHIHSLAKSRQFSNSRKGLLEFVQWSVQNVEKTKETLYVFEHTGMYSHLISKILSENNLNYFIASGLDIKRSMGITRGKDDEIDAKRIALYGYRLKEEITPSKYESDIINQLKSLMNLKSKLIKQRASYRATLKEQKNIYSVKEFKIMFDVQEKMIHYLSKQIDKLQLEIEQIISKESELKNNFDLITSIKGVGKQMAITMIIVTGNFEKFDNWRKFASYCGIAPFPFKSGTSIRGRNKVSHLANKKIKAMIHLCALTSIQHNPEMRIYYLKRIEKGKSKMSTINIIRNKLISRIFAVVNRQTEYVNTLKFAA